MKWLLFVLLFTSTPYNDPHAKCGGKTNKCYAEMDRDEKLAYIDKKDKSHVWTLQTTTMTEYVNETACDEAGARIYAAVAPVSTLTFRGYCLCSPLKEGDNACPADPTDQLADNAVKKSLKGPGGSFDFKMLLETERKKAAASKPTQAVSMHQITKPFLP